MGVGDFPIAVVVALLPGILATITIKKLTISGTWDNFKVGLYTVVYSGIAYTIYFFCVNYLIGGGLIESTSVDDLIKEIRAVDIIIASLGSVILGVVVAAASNHKLLFKGAQTLNITNKFGDEDLYYDFMRDDNNTQVYLKDFENNITYHGFVTGYSQSKESREIELTQVVVYSYNESEEMYRLKNLYLTIGIGDKFIVEVPQIDQQTENEEREEK